MRSARAAQQPLVPITGSQQHARELRAISQLLDNEPGIARLAHEDLTAGKREDLGRVGMSGDQVVRVALLKQMNALTYRELAFHLEDSAAFQAFARLPFGRTVKWTTLQANVKRLRPETWEAINSALVRFAFDKKIENGRKIRVDTTAVEANIHPPTDSALLWDCIRVVTRLLHRIADEFPTAHAPFTDHTRRAKRRAYSIKFPPRGKRREGHLKRAYRDLLKVARKTYSNGTEALARLSAFAPAGATASPSARALATELEDFLHSMRRVIDQTTRRVVHGESVPSHEKLVSIFETHAAVIVKGARDVVFGHKVCVTGGASSLILDCVIEQGNPSDVALVDRSLRRQVELYGKPPRQASFDGAFASRANLEAAKELGVEDVAFQKKCGLEVTDMVRSAWVFRRLVRFRSGIEGCISALKRAFRMDRCTWRDLPSFRSYVWSCIVAFNLAVIARHLLA